MMKPIEIVIVKEGLCVGERLDHYLLYTSSNNLARVLPVFMLYHLQTNLCTIPGILKMVVLSEPPDTAQLVVGSGFTVGDVNFHCNILTSFGEEVRDQSCGALIALHHRQYDEILVHVGRSFS